MITYTQFITLVALAFPLIKAIILLTPTKKDDNMLIQVLKIIDTLGLPNIQAKKRK